jgi:hypothetical protein
MRALMAQRFAGAQAFVGHDFETGFADQFRRAREIVRRQGLLEAGDSRAGEFRDAA